MTVSVVSAPRIPVANFRTKDSAIVSSFVRVMFERFVISSGRPISCHLLNEHKSTSFCFSSETWCLLAALASW